MIEKEFEVKIIGYSFDELLDIVKRSGAYFVKEEHQYNYRFITADLNGDSYLRLRVTDEYSEFTLKRRLENGKVRSNTELTSQIENPDSFLEIMESIGINYILQKKVRYKYILDNFVFDLDIWDKDVYPYPYLEIEVPSPDDLEVIIEKLNIDYKNITTKSIGELIKDLS